MPWGGPLGLGMEGVKPPPTPAPNTSSNCLVVINETARTLLAVTRGQYCLRLSSTG